MCYSRGLDFIARRRFSIVSIASISARLALVLVVACVGLAAAAPSDEKAAEAAKDAYAGAGCAANIDGFFADEVWPKVGAQTCLECHKDGGDADESEFILQDPKR